MAVSYTHLDVYKRQALNYVLHEKEIFESLKISGFCKTMGKRAVIETIILLILTVIFVISSIFNKNYDSLFFAVISLLLIGIIWIVPRQGMKNKAKFLANGKEIHVEIYPDEIQIHEGKNSEWNILLDGSSECTIMDHIFIIKTPKDQILILPMRCVEPVVLPEVQAMLAAGTQMKIKK